MSMISQLAVSLYFVFMMWWVIDWTLGLDKVKAMATWFERNFGDIGALSIIVSFVVSSTITLLYIGDLIGLYFGKSGDRSLYILTDGLSIFLFIVVGFFGLFVLLKKIRMQRIG